MVEHSIEEFSTPTFACGADKELPGSVAAARPDAGCVAQLQPGEQAFSGGDGGSSGEGMLLAPMWVVMMPAASAAGSRAKTGARRNA